MTDVTVQLDDGHVVELSCEAAEAVYELLWRLAPEMRGAVTTAAKLRQAQTVAAVLGKTVTLDHAESAVFLAARRRAEPAA